MTDATLRFDGGARPGNAAAGALLADTDGRTVTHAGVRLGTATNNTAEHTGLKVGLELALAAGVERLTVYGDSELVLGHAFLGHHVGSEHLRELVAAERALIARFPAIRHRCVVRELNAPADAICNAVADGWYAAPGAVQDDGSALLGYVASLEVEATLARDPTGRSTIKRALVEVVTGTFPLAIERSVTRTGTDPYYHEKAAIITYLVKLHVSAHVAGDAARRAHLEVALHEVIVKHLPVTRARIARVSG